MPSAPPMSSRLPADSDPDVALAAHPAPVDPAPVPEVPAGFALATGHDPSAAQSTQAQSDGAANDEMPESKTVALVAFFRGFLRDLAFFVGLFFFIYYFVMNVSVVRGKSMEPTFHDGDRLIVDKITYRLGDLSEANRFDVVVLKNPNNPKEDYIKRLVAFPGEYVEMRNGILLIDGVRMDYEGAHLDRANFSRTKVEEGHYFVLGDNRGKSNDSRIFHGVPRDYIKGKIRLRFWPPDSIHLFGSDHTNDEIAASARD